MKRGGTTLKARQPYKKPRTVVPTKVLKPNNKFTANRKLGPEVKNIDINQSFVITASSALFAAPVDLNVVAQGNSAETRNGRKIVMKSLLFRWYCNLGATSTGGSPIRWLIVYDKQTNAAAPAMTDILTLNGFLSPMNLANSERFVVLKSWITDPISLQNNFSVAGECYIPMALETVFNDTNAGTVADINTGGIFVSCSQDAAIATANGAASFYARIRFEDQ